MLFLVRFDYYDKTSDLAFVLASNYEDLRSKVHTHLLTNEKFHILYTFNQEGPVFIETPAFLKIISEELQIDKE